MRARFWRVRLCSKTIVSEMIPRFDGNGNLPVSNYQVVFSNKKLLQSAYRVMQGL
jgi:hypothetical protein